ncbi:MAG: DUF362 domain-containing protein [Candidatus Thermoplasmatota archaeon]|nr:DUF362 domain-containing protein [Candidatus Thermoplasmatota archaeon]MBS3789588.1 DUF362 domain-containing protein [Candidatus Thermoplasmatota archaeon]
MEVFINRCTSYDECYEVVEDAFEELGGISNFVKDGETILVNPNLLKGSSPDKAVVTHPDFIIAVVRVLEKKDVDIIVGDSPAGRMTEKKLEDQYEKSGWKKIESETNARLNYDVGSTKRDISTGSTKKTFDILSLVEEVDGIINLPKLKTHSLTVFTGAVKNKYGLVHGLTKAAYHGQFTRLNQFGKMLLDVNEAVDTRLTVMDGIIGMEGDGPSGGEPVELDCVIASEDPLAVDYAACKLTGIPPQKVPTILEMEFDFEEIEYLNRHPNSFERDIDYPSGGSTPYRVPNILTGLFANFYLDRPELNEEKCIKCWECQEACPKDAITGKSYGPKISWWKCIRCYCCAETCPEEALKP